MRTMAISRTAALLITAASLAAILTGCAAEQPDGARSHTPVPSAAAVESPSPSATTSAQPTPDPATCETVLTDAEYAALEDEGLALRGDADGVSQDPNKFGGSGGIRCTWLRPQSDVMAWYSHWPSDEETWDSLKTDLVSEGYTEISDPFAGIIQSPPDPNYTPALTYRDGVVYYVSTPQLFRSVLALQ